MYLLEDIMNVTYNANVTKYSKIIHGITISIKHYVCIWQKMLNLLKLAISANNGFPDYSVAFKIIFVIGI